MRAIQRGARDARPWRAAACAAQHRGPAVAGQRQVGANLTCAVGTAVAHAGHPSSATTRPVASVLMRSVNVGFRLAASASRFKRSHCGCESVPGSNRPVNLLCGTFRNSAPRPSSTPSPDSCARQQQPAIIPAGPPPAITTVVDQPDNSATHARAEIDTRVVISPLRYVLNDHGVDLGDSVANRTRSRSAVGRPTSRAAGEHRPCQLFRAGPRRRSQAAATRSAP